MCHLQVGSVTTRYRQNTYIAPTRKRKVKCDEGFPTCRRCVSTGRVCDGYSVWGGGGNRYESRQAIAILELDVPLAPPYAKQVAGRVGEALFDWYRCRTATKIPGAFFSNFWTILLPQASHTEPAILHAVLALSATHWDGTMGRKVGTDTPPKMERFTLEHYNQAIHYLNDKPPAQASSSRRVALITCLVFIAIDLLRGHFATAQFHLQSGLKLLGHESLSGASLLFDSQCPDKWIAEMFSRLLVQFELFGQPYHRPHSLLESITQLPQAVRFANFREAWLGLQNLINVVFALTQYARVLKRQSGSPAKDTELLGRQQRLRAGLVWWSSMYESSRYSLQGSSSRELAVAYLTLRSHHTMATIMADVALAPDDEMAFDEHTTQFVRLIHDLGYVWAAVTAREAGQLTLPGRLADAGAIVDMGWIPPLYYTATKCRNHRIRVQATRFLEYSSHREGIWDSDIVSCIARRIIQVEEGGYYNGSVFNDKFQISSPPLPEDLEGPILPEANRLKGLKVTLSGSPLDKIHLYCQRDESDMGTKMRVGSFDVAAQQWEDDVACPSYRQHE